MSSAGDKYPVTRRLRALPPGTIVGRSEVRKAAYEQNSWDFESSDSTLASRIWTFPSYLRAQTPLELLMLVYQVGQTRLERYAGLLEQQRTAPPIVCDLSICEIIDGNHRYAAARAAGRDSISTLIGLPDPKRWPSPYDGEREISRLRDGIEASLPADVFAELRGGALAYLYD